jgi:hypothetical protein
VTVKDNKNCTVTATYAHAIPAVAQTNVLLPWSSTWKYKDDGSNQGTAWRASAFDDSAWPSAVAEFGYGDGDETTLVNACGTVQQTPTCTNKYLTTYLRKKINIASTATFQSIKFNTFRDDGIIVFVNGTEVYRSGVQTGTINYNTTLSSSASDDGETLQTQTVTLAASLLVVGDNTIAVELHQQNGSSSDLTFNMEILATTATPPVVTTTPYLQPVTPNALYTTILTTGDVVNGYTMCGTPDGLGAFDNGNGTFTILMNHEFGSTAGVARAHGSKGAFVSKWTVNKSTLAVTAGADLIQTVKLWNGTGYTTYNSSNPSSLTAFNRFCSADLPAVSAFYNSATGLGTQERIFMNGEEAGSEGRGFAHIATGSEAGTYKVIAKNTSTGLTANMNGTATIIVNSLPADINQNGTVDVADLSQLLLNFGITCTCPSDINQDGQVNVADLSQLLLTFGQTCSGVFPINPSGSAQEN